MKREKANNYTFSLELPQRVVIEIETLTNQLNTHKNTQNKKQKNTTLNNGYLGSRDDEERSEMRYVMRIAEFSESSNL